MTPEDCLRAEVARLTALLRDTAAVFPRTWSLTPGEENVFRALLAHDIATVAVVVEAVNASAAAIRVFIHRIRQKLTPHNVEIETLQGRGWRLVGREQWAAILKSNS